MLKSIKFIKNIVIFNIYFLFLKIITIRLINENNIKTKKVIYIARLQNDLFLIIINIFFVQNQKATSFSKKKLFKTINNKK